MTPTFRDILARARRITHHMTAAEFDYDLTLGPDSTAALRAVDNAIYQAANAGHDDTDLDACRARYSALHAQLRPEFEALIAEAKAKTYTGWSHASRARGAKIRYAS